MSKPKTYEYEGRTFEVKTSYNDETYWVIYISVNEVIRPNRKFFGRTRFFCDDFIFPDQYLSIDDAVKEVIARGLWQEEYKKFARDKWKERVIKRENVKKTLDNSASV